jgi:signal transduction histidine kinase/DNA-binding response OmpR family regulator
MYSPGECPDPARRTRNATPAGANARIDVTTWSRTMPFTADDHGCPGWKGEMAERIRSFDWTATELGPIGQWQQSLVAAVQFVLGSPLPIVMLWGKQGYMVYNDAYAVFAGGRHPYLLGCPVELGWPEVASFNRNVVDTCLAGGTLSYVDKELVLLRNGKPEDVWMDLYYSPVADDSSAPAGVIAVVVETTGRVLTERSRQHAETALRLLTETLEQRVTDAVAARTLAEAQLRQAQKMEAIGSLTGGVAHDFNNVLQVINGNLQMLAADAGEHPATQRRIAAATQAVKRGAQLAAHLLAFARRQPLSPAVLNPRRLLDGMSEMLHRALGETIRVDTILGPDLWNVLADRNQLENALLNLSINGRDAMHGEGTLTIRAENLVVAERDNPGYADLSAGEYLVFSIADTGIGMPAEVLARAVEPFFTTKPNGHGTGLGLSMVFGFVKQSGGHTVIDSVVGKGTTVQLFFPRCREAETIEVADLSEAPVGGRETILVVEDDAEVRLTAVEMLMQLGYKVLTAADGDAALEFVDSDLQIDLLFTDVVMPGTVKSVELAQRAALRSSAIPVLFTSGYTRDEIFHHGKLDAGVTLLSKPYRRDDLAGKVRGVLNAHRAKLANTTTDTPHAVAAPYVLLVEDDLPSREAMGELLESFGLQHTSVASAEEALKLASTQRYDILLSDISLPGLSGDALARALRSTQPHLRILLMSGYGESAEIGQAIPGARLLAKPVDIEALRRELAASAPHIEPAA